MQAFELLEARRLFSSGGLDRSFATNGELNQVLGTGHFHITTTAVQSGGRLLVGGNHTLVGKSGTLPFLFRFKADGTLDDRFAGTATVATLGRGSIENIFAEPDGLLRVNFGGDATSEIVGMTVSGRLDSSFTTIGSTYVSRSSAFALQPDGKLLLGGSSSDGVTIFRFNENGSADTTFGTGGQITTKLARARLTGSPDALYEVDLHSISVSDSGQIYLGADYYRFDQVTSYRHPLVARLTASGATDRKFARTSVYEFDADQTAQNFTASTQQVVATNDGGVLVSITDGADSQKAELFRFSKTGSVGSVIYRADTYGGQLLYEPTGSYLFSLGGTTRQFTADDMLNDSFGKHGAITDTSADALHALSTDDTLYTTSLSSTASSGVSSFTQTTTRHFLQTGPVALLNIAELDSAPDGSYTFTVQYRSDTKVKQSTLGGDDLRVFLPDGSNVKAVYYKSSSSADAPVITAFYKIAPIGGAWDAADNGVYRIKLNLDALTNIAGIATPSTTLGYFRIAL